MGKAHPAVVRLKMIEKRRRDLLKRNAANRHADHNQAENKRVEIENTFGNHETGGTRRTVAQSDQGQNNPPEGAVVGEKGHYQRSGHCQIDQQDVEEEFQRVDFECSIGRAQTTAYEKCPEQNLNDDKRVDVELSRSEHQISEHETADDGVVALGENEQENDEKRLSVQIEHVALRGEHSIVEQETTNE